LADCVTLSRYSNTMARRKHKRLHKTGKPPGSLIFTGRQKTEKVTTQLIEFDENDIWVKEDVTLEEMTASKISKRITWVNICGLHEPDYIGQVGDIFGIHALLLEDILNVDHRPGYYEDDQVLVAIVKMLTPDPSDPFTQTEQISIVCGDGFLISFQELTGDVLNTVRERLIRPSTRIRSRKSDYLAYALLDSIVDQYLVTIDEFGERVEDLEEELIQGKNPKVLDKIYGYKKDINFLRKIIRPVREVALQFQKSDAAWVDDSTDPFLKDLVDHAEYAADSVETFRETINDQLNFYHTQATSKLNDILRVLTIFSVVFIPLNFLAGMYGTNFEFIPGLHKESAWWMFVSVQVVLGLGMFFYFKKRKWL
jgi:magnesium transporter